MKILAICGRLILFFIYMGIVAISIIPMAIFAFIKNCQENPAASSGDELVK
jgi:hypothetical protein